MITEAEFHKQLQPLKEKLVESIKATLKLWGEVKEPISVEERFEEVLTLLLVSLFANMKRQAPETFTNARIVEIIQNAYNRAYNAVYLGNPYITPRNQA